MLLIYVLLIHASIYCSPWFLVNIITIDKNTNLTVGLQMGNAANMTKHFFYSSLGEFCFPIWNRLSTSSTLLVLLLLCMNSVYGKFTRKIKWNMTSIQVISIGIRWNFDGLFFSNIDRTWNDEICDSIHSQFWLESTYLNISQLHPRDMRRDCLELRRIANACDSVDFLVPLLTTWAGGPVPLFVGFCWSMNHPPTTKPKKQTKWIVCKGIRSVLFQPCFFS